MCDPCEPPAELAIGVTLFPAGAEHATRALLDVDRTKTDQVTITLQPADGTDEHAIYFTRAASAALDGMLTRAWTTEVRHG